jgi:hypothetical protein
MESTSFFTVHMVFYTPGIVQVISDNRYLHSLSLYLAGRGLSLLAIAMDRGEERVPTTAKIIGFFTYSYLLPYS